MKSVIHMLQILMSLGLGILYPFWLIDGVFDGSLYAIIGSAIAIYGSLFGGIYYEYLRRKRKQK